MPELPEVEHVVRALRRAVTGRQIVATEVALRKLVLPSSPASCNRKLKGARIDGVSRRGKFILIELDPGMVLVVHLRMTGKFLYLTSDDPTPRYAHVVFHFDNERRLYFCDQRQFAVMKLMSRKHAPKMKALSQLAPEPLSDGFSVNYLRETLRRSRRALKQLLLDQTRVLGLGNIYAAEALFRAGISPFKVATDLSLPRIKRLHQSIRDVLSDAMKHSSTSRIDLENPDGHSYGEAFERLWQVYEREDEPCLRCAARIRRINQAGRSTYWCPRCQRT
jgi:formamidopyrimidine-DNA glycosylase